MSESIQMKNTPQNFTLLNNSITQLVHYRRLQSKNLKTRLSLFTKVVLDKYGSIENTKRNGLEAVESQQDINIINKLVELESYVTFPTYSKDNKSITHFYTIGFWYYWGLPEIVLQFDQPIRENAEFANVIINIIHDELFSMWHDRIIIENSKCISINRMNFEEEPNRIVLNLDKFDLKFILNKIKEDKYMDIKAMYMMWFYMYYMDAIKDEKEQPCLYPVYILEIKRTDYANICKKIMDKLLHSAMEKLKDENEDTDSSDDDISFTEGEDELNDKEKNTLPTIREETEKDIL
jgi:hypothetical protein